MIMGKGGMETITFYYGRYGFRILKKFRTGELKLLRPKVYILCVNRFYICIKTDMMSKGGMDYCAMQDAYPHYKVSNILTRTIVNQ